MLRWLKKNARPLLSFHEQTSRARALWDPVSAKAKTEVSVVQWPQRDTFSFSSFSLEMAFVDRNVDRKINRQLSNLPRQEPKTAVSPVSTRRVKILGFWSSTWTQ